jgi:hypothetical protein
MPYDFILAIDPSGSFSEGKGCTGWCILEHQAQRITLTGNIHAKSYQQMESYWQAHLSLINRFKDKYKQRLCVVMEDYILYASKSEAQINSRMETPKLIGIVQLHCFMCGVPYHMQLAAQVKNRWTDDILNHKGILLKKKKQLVTPSGETVDRHCRDAIRHAVHFSTFKNKEGVG